MGARAGRLFSLPGDNPQGERRAQSPKTRGGPWRHRELDARKYDI
jgi:hypothetical protein